jgi:Tfp pilus assembly protein PilO
VKPKRFFYVLCALLAVLVLAGGAGYYYASQSLNAGTSILSQRLGDEQVADDSISALEDLHKRHQQLTPLIPAIDAALPAQKDESTIALQLHNLAAANSMQLNSLTFAASTVPSAVSQTVAAGGALAVPISFQLSGTYQQLQGFLQGQERLSRYTSVTSLGISSTGSSNLAFSISLNAFLKP